MHASEQVAQRQERSQFHAVRALVREGRKTWTRERLVDLQASRGPGGLVAALVAWLRSAWVDALQPTVASVRLAGHATGRAGLEIVDVVRKAELTFSFDEVDPNAVRAAREFRNALITQVSQQTAEAIQLTVADGIRRGLSPLVIAERVRLVIGLTPRQAQALINYEDGLVRQSKAILTRSGNEQLEAEVLEAWRDGRQATDAQRSRLVHDYADRLLDQRATTIARTETLRAANLGAELSIRQARDAGLFGDLEVRRFWLATNDEKTRPEHREIPKLNASGVALDEPFVYPGGRRIARPGDPLADASMTINCRCTVLFRLVRRR